MCYRKLQVHKSWDPLVAGTCLAPGPSFTAYAIVTIVSDIVVAVIPIPVLLKLKVNTGKKVGLIVIFLLGLFTTLCSVFRYLQINRIQFGDGNSTMLILWGVIEFNVGVSRVAVSDPPFPPKSPGPPGRSPKESRSNPPLRRTSSPPSPSWRPSSCARPRSTPASTLAAAVVATTAAGRASSASRATHTS